MPLLPDLPGVGMVAERPHLMFVMADEMGASEPTFANAPCRPS
jgi:hypothetical protein